MIYSDISIVMNINILNSCITCNIFVRLIWPISWTLKKIENIKIFYHFMQLLFKIINFDEFRYKIYKILYLKSSVLIQ